MEAATAVRALPNSGAHDSFRAVRFWAGVGDVIALAIEADDEHGASVALAHGLVGGEFGRLTMVWCDISDALAEAAMAELVGTAEEIDGIFEVVGSHHGLHGAVMAIAEGQDVRPHALRV